MTISKRLHAAVLAAVLFIAVIAAFNVAKGAASSRTPAWCDYPEPQSVAALMAAVDRHAATIARYSPEQPVDRFTLQLDLMTQCA